MERENTPISFKKRVNDAVRTIFTEQGLATDETPAGHAQRIKLALQFGEISTGLKADHNSPDYRSAHALGRNLIKEATKLTRRSLH